MDIPYLIIYSSADRYFPCFCIMAIMNNAAMDIFVQGFLCLFYCSHLCSCETISYSASDVYCPND